ncbi:amino acid transporter [Penicillium malachiteum]|uniref:Amino acid transporter n=1 Tax=Penicillium malachiteum TaxID=1324776 RepID=A0AAD6MYF0_9EURO|nr:amino acid transporter [Penicillium malachiteum]
MPLRSGEENSFHTQDGVALSSKDAYELARVGKKEVLKYLSGGPAGLVYGFIAVWMAFISIFIALGELASMIPSAGGQYHWTSILAPKSSTRFFSHITGCICIIAWTAGSTGTIYTAGSIFQSTFAINHPNYDPKGWHVTLIMWGLLLICSIFSMWLGMILPVLEVFIGIVHVLGFFAFLIPIVYLGPRADVKSVFVQTFNFGGWSDVTLAAFVGLKGTISMFLGTDGVVHMAEEVANSSLVVPQSMLFAIVINGILGFAMMIAFLFTAGDLSAIVKSQATYPFMQIIENSTGSQGASIVLSTLMAVMSVCCGLGGISSGSRMLWAFSRERTIPGWQWVYQLDERTAVPFHSILIIVITAGLIGLINIGSSSVLSIVLSLTMEAFFFSYMIPLSLLLYRRIKGDIHEPGQDSNKSPGLTWGPFRVRGIWGILNNIVALVFCAVAVIFGFWPNENHPPLSKMNWSSVIFSSAIILAVFHYLGWGRKHYMGPVMEVQVEERGVEPTGR